ncbi:MAG: hypothetical protein OEV76_05080 [Anaerolineae bacterium]|nr:hypothetical protein [Anaerolineae bacterium]
MSGKPSRKGVEWLVLQQNPDGSFGSYGYPQSVAVTGLAVKKLMHYAVDPKYGLERAGHPFWSTRLVA